MNGCPAGGCGSCSGCAKSLELTQPEIDLLLDLGQFSFLPVARRADDMTPVYLEACTCPPETVCLVLQVLEQKGLISMDYEKPLAGADMSAYKGYPVHGSIALTAKGQTVVEFLEIQGITQ